MPSIAAGDVGARQRVLGLLDRRQRDDRLGGLPAGQQRAPRRASRCAESASRWAARRGRGAVERIGPRPAAGPAAALSNALQPAGAGGEIVDRARDPLCAVASVAGSAPSAWPPLPASPRCARSRRCAVGRLLDAGLQLVDARRGRAPSRCRAARRRSARRRAHPCSESTPVLASSTDPASRSRPRACLGAILLQRALLARRARGRRAASPARSWRSIRARRPSAQPGRGAACASSLASAVEALRRRHRAAIGDRHELEARAPAGAADAADRFEVLARLARGRQLTRVRSAGAQVQRRQREREQQQRRGAARERRTARDGGGETAPTPTGARAVDGRWSRCDRRRASAPPARRTSAPITATIATVQTPTAADSIGRVGLSAAVSTIASTIAAPATTTCGARAARPPRRRLGCPTPARRRSRTRVTISSE